MEKKINISYRVRQYSSELVSCLNTFIYLFLQPHHFFLFVLQLRRTPVQFTLSLVKELLRPTIVIIVLDLQVWEKPFQEFLKKEWRKKELRREGGAKRDEQREVNGEVRKGRKKKR